MRHPKNQHKDKLAKRMTQNSSLAGIIKTSQDDKQADTPRKPSSSYGARLKKITLTKVASRQGSGGTFTPTRINVDELGEMNPDKENHYAKAKNH